MQRHYRRANAVDEIHDHLSIFSSACGILHLGVMSHSYELIKLLSKCIMCDCGMFIPVSNGIKIR